MNAPPAVPTGNTYDKYATKNPIERRLVANFLARLDDMLPARVPARILEVVIGEGDVAARVTERFPDASFVGIDLPGPARAGDLEHGVEHEGHRRQLGRRIGMRERPANRAAVADLEVPDVWDRASKERHVVKEPTPV